MSQDFVRGFADLSGAVISAGQMQTRHDTATYVVGRDAHYVLTVNRNQPGLYQACKKLPWRAATSHTSVDESHTRRLD